MYAMVVCVAVMANLVHAAPNYYPTWHGPLASPTVLPSGFLADTPEVAAIKAALGAGPAPYAPTNAVAPSGDYTPKWTGPLATPVVLPSGFLADTPEVAALKTAHIANYGHGSYYH